MERLAQDSEEGALERIKAANGGVVPDWWNNPLRRAEALGLDFSQVVVDAHLSQFAQSYAGPNRFGDEKLARRIGYLRNIKGQGMPPTGKLDSDE